MSCTGHYRDGSLERTVAALSRGDGDIDQRYSNHYFTPLMHAASSGYLRIARILLNNGANLATVNGDGATALHMSAQE